LFFLRSGRRFGIEFKFSEAPKATKSMRMTLETLHLKHLWIITPGLHHCPVDDKVSVWPLPKLAELPEQIRWLTMRH
jgi:uncharacterized protein